MKKRIEGLLRRAGVTYKSVLVLGSFVHMSFHSEAQAKRAAMLFPASHYAVTIFERLVETPHGRHKYGKEWKTVARAKEQSE